MYHQLCIYFDVDSEIHFKSPIFHHSNHSSFEGWELFLLVSLSCSCSPTITSFITVILTEAEYIFRECSV